MRSNFVLSMYAERKKNMSVEGLIVTGVKRTGLSKSNSCIRRARNFKSGEMSATKGKHEECHAYSLKGTTWIWSPQGEGRIPQHISSVGNTPRSYFCSTFKLLLSTSRSTAFEVCSVNTQGSSVASRQRQWRKLARLRC